MAHHDTISAHFKAHPTRSFTVRELADEIGLPVGTTSATIASYLPMLPIAPVGSKPSPAGRKGGRAATLFRYDPNKPLESPATRRRKAQIRKAKLDKAKSKELVAVQPAPVPAVNGQKRTMRVQTNDTFARVVGYLADGHSVILETTAGEIIRGKVLHE